MRVGIILALCICLYSCNDDSYNEIKMLKEGDTTSLKNGLYYGTFVQTIEDGNDNDHNIYTAAQITVLNGYVSEIRDSVTLKLILDIHHIIRGRLGKNNEAYIKDDDLADDWVMIPWYKKKYAHRKIK